MRRRMMNEGPWEAREALRGAFGPWGPGPQDMPFPPFRGGPHGRGRGRGRGAKRGDVRAAVLALLNERPMHGYEMIQELDARTEGVWRPSPGSVYPTLQMLEDEGLITSEREGGKKLFTLTEAGTAEAQRIATGTTPWEEVTDRMPRGFGEARTVGAQIAMAAAQISQAGTEEQRAAALEVLKDTRRRLYRILAEEEDPTD